MTAQSGVSGAGVGAGGRARGFADGFRRHYPLTTLGTAAALALIAVFINAFRTAASYDLALALLGFAALGVLLIAVRAQLRAYDALECGLQPVGRAAAARGGISFRLSGIERETVLFTRVHAVLNASLEHSADASLRMRREVSSGGGEPILLRAATPLSGRLRLQVTTELRDVFSLVRAQFGDRLERTELVLPGPPPGVREYDIDSYSAAEEHRRQNRSEHERYYMREYTPGDRLRDINWKASSRLPFLITRVSPQSEEPTTVVQIEVRHYRAALTPPSLDSVIHLEMLRAWVLWFIRSLSNNAAAIRFRVQTAGTLLEAETEEEIDRVAEHLSTLEFVSPRAAQPAPGRQRGEWFVFSTPFDTTRAARLRGEREHLLATAPAPGRGAAPGPGRAAAARAGEGGAAAGGAAAGGAQVVTVFPGRALSALPGTWALRRTRDLAPAQAEPGDGLLETLSILPRLI